MTEQQEVIALRDKAMEEQDLLKLVGVVEIPATDEFFAREKFVLKKEDYTAGPRIDYIRRGFNWFFLNKIEKPAGKSKLKYYGLLKDSRYATIIDVLGGEEKSETTLAAVYFLMKSQQRDQEGVLLNDGRANIFFVPSVNNMFYAVIIDWFDKGWEVGAVSVLYPHELLGGARIFSPDLNSC